MTQLDSLYFIDISYPSENSILLEWPEKICVKQHRQIIACQQQVNRLLAEFIIDSIASYNSLMIYYSLEKVVEKVTLKKFVSLMGEIIVDVCKLSTNSIISGDKSAEPSPLEPDQLDIEPLKIIEIPVYYGEDAGWDLQRVAEQSALTIEEVIELHSQTTYRAYALGFTPGFCYLASINEKLRHARRQSPRVVVPKGAVAIAEKQTAIYPNKSPGGWHIIGQTPMAMYKTGGDPSLLHPSELNRTFVDDSFVVQNHEPSFIPTIAVGQEIRFKAISYQEFCRLGGVLVIESKSLENEPPENQSLTNKLQAS